jgi:RNA polymerase sigma-70 factor (ECF subfamily)
VSIESSAQVVLSRDAFANTYADTYTRVRAYVARRCADQAAVEDVLSETYLAAWRNVDTLPEDPLPWLFRAAANALRNHARAGRRHSNLRTRLSLVFREEALTRPESSDSTLQAALESLSNADQQVLMLTYWDDLSPHQCAAVLDISDGAYRVRLHRAQTRLATAINPIAVTENRNPETQEAHP